MPPLNHELSDYEISMLNDFLKKATKDANFTPDICWLEGYLCAINSSVELILPSKWVDRIKNENFKFETNEQGEAITLLLEQFYNRVNEATHQKTYVPIYNWHKFKHSPKLELAARWANGYLLGTMIANEDLLELREIKTILMPIVIVSGVIPDKELDEEISRAEMIDKIPKSVQVMLKLRNVTREHIPENNLLTLIIQ